MRRRIASLLVLGVACASPSLVQARSRTVAASVVPCKAPVPPGPDYYRPYPGPVVQDTMTLREVIEWTDSAAVRLRNTPAPEGVACAIRFLASVTGLDSARLAVSPLSCALRARPCGAAERARGRGSPSIAVVVVRITRDGTSGALLAIGLTVFASGGVPDRTGSTLQREFELRLHWIPESAGWTTTYYADYIPE